MRRSYISLLKGKAEHRKKRPKEAKLGGRKGKKRCGNSKLLGGKGDVDHI